MKSETLLILAGVAALAFFYMSSQQRNAQVQAAVAAQALQGRALDAQRQANNITAISNGIGSLAGTIGSWFSK